MSFPVLEHLPPPRVHLSSPPSPRSIVPNNSSYLSIIRVLSWGSRECFTFTFPPLPHHTVLSLIILPTYLSSGVLGMLSRGYRGCFGFTFKWGGVGLFNASVELIKRDISSSVDHTKRLIMTRPVH